ncbi:MAG: YcxB family protein [Paludibacter sp.]|nr:YcxB family protein [Paludibacter sp.]
MDKITLTTKLSFNDFIKVSYHLTYRKLSVKLMTVFGLMILLLVPFSNNYETEFPWFLLFFGFFISVGQPIILYFITKKNYMSNGRISETIIYEFDYESILVTGESFNSRLTWDKVYSVTENKDWILIWQNRQSANVLPKRDFKNEELQLFKEIVNSHSELKNKLKK